MFSRTFVVLFLTRQHMTQMIRLTSTGLHSENNLALMREIAEKWLASQWSRDLGMTE